MIKVDKLSYSFPKNNLYNKISFTLEQNQHCAFIGVSGSGKSTLVDIIMDPEGYMFDGNIEMDSHCRIGYVSQSPQEKIEKLTVFEYMGQESIRLQKELTSIALEMETSSDIDFLLEKYQESLDAYEALGGDDFESTINIKLSLGNLMKHKNQLVSELSGGEFKLIQIIKEMLTAPDLLIMDGPDVFLDFENLNSLKNLINAYKGSLLVITHNRYLLNHCFNKILHLENMSLHEFDGGYIDYNFSLLQSKIQLQELAHADNEEIKRNEILIERLRLAAERNAHASIGKYVNARAKIIERLEARRIQAPFLYTEQSDINLITDNEIEPSIALKVHDFNFSFEDTLLEDVNFEIKSTDKVILIGPNGTGKTTLLRELFKNNHDSIEFHEDIKVAYLSQIQGEMLNESNTIAEELFDAGFKTYDEISKCILSYGFKDEFIHQKIESLSVGEKNIIQLIKISTSNANMLLLDEPSSHLDTYSQIALEKALKDYNGAILMISHDFYSIVNSMDYALIIEDKSIRKMNMRKFRKMIYKNYFDRDYLELEQKKKLVETKIESALQDNDFTLAKVLCEELESLIN